MAFMNSIRCRGYCRNVKSMDMFNLSCFLVERANFLLVVWQSSCCHETFETEQLKFYNVWDFRTLLSRSRSTTYCFLFQQPSDGIPMLCIAGLTLSYQPSCRKASFKRSCFGWMTTGRQVLNAFLFGGGCHKQWSVHIWKPVQLKTIQIQLTVDSHSFWCRLFQAVQRAASYLTPESDSHHVDRAQ